MAPVPALHRPEQILVTAGLALVSALEISGVRAYQPGPRGQKITGLLAACGAGHPGIGKLITAVAILGAVVS